MKTFLNKNDYIFGLFWIGLIGIIFFLPVALGFQSLLEAYPVLYQGHNLIPPQIKTPWVIDGATMVRSTVPTVLLAIQTLKSGHFPFWSPYDGAGENLLLLAGGLYNPLRLLYFFLFDSARAFDWSIIIRTILAGFGMFLYLRALGLRRNSSLFGGIAYMFSGYFFMFLTYWFLDVEAILPYVLFSMERYFSAGRGEHMRFVFLAGVLVGLLTVTGQPQSVILSTILFAGYFFWRVFADPMLRPMYIAHFIKFVFIMGIAALIALPYAIDFLTLLHQGITIYDYGSFVTAKHGLEYASLFYLLRFIVSPSTVMEIAIGGHLFNQFSFMVPYLALTVIFLIFLSFFISRKPAFVSYFYAFSGFALLKLFGIPPVQWIGHLPILNNIGWHKLYGPLSLACVVIAAYTYNALPAVSINRKKFLITIASIPLLFLLVYLAMPQRFLQSYIPDLDFINRRPETVQSAMKILDAFPEGIRSALIAFIQDGRYFTAFLFSKTILFSVISISLILWAIGKKDGHKARIFLFIFLIFELWVYMPKVRDGFRYFNPYVTPPFVAFLQQHAPGSQFGVISTDYTFPVSLGDMFHVRKFQTTSAVFPSRFRQFVPDTIKANDHDYFKLKAGDVTKTPQKFFDAANLKYLVTEATSSFASKNFSLVYDEDLKIYENRTSLPRAYMIFQKVTASSPEDAHDKFYATSFDPTRAVILEDHGAVALKGKTASYESVTIKEYFPDRVVVETHSERDGILVLTDTFYSAWHAELDGDIATVYPANVLFRGVFVPAGSHTIIFTFKNLWFWPSIIISFGTFLLSLLFVFQYNRLKSIMSHIFHAR